MWRGPIILTDYDCGHAYHLREVSRARFKSKQMTLQYRAETQVAYYQ
jgi:hypothetical protein